MIDRSPTYRDIVCLLAQAVHYCGRQGIALRGHRENLESEGNPGNFLALVKLLADHNPVLKRHLESAETKYKYLHNKNQNELIDIIGYEIIQKDILKEIKDAQFHSIMIRVYTISANLSVWADFGQISAFEAILVEISAFQAFLESQRIF